MADSRWPPFGNHDVITTARFGTQRKHLGTFYRSSNSRCQIFYTCEGMVAPAYQKSSIQANVNACLEREKGQQTSSPLFPSKTLRSNAFVLRTKDQLAVKDCGLVLTQKMCW